MRSYFPFEIEEGDHGKEGAKQVGHFEGGYFGDVSSGYHAYADANVPRGEVGAGSGTALLVGCQVDKQCIVCRKHDAESDA